MSFQLRRAIVTGVFALALAATSLASDTSQVVGRWDGFGQSDTNGRFIIPCVDVLTPGERNRFQATVVFDTGEIQPCIFPIYATLSEAGVINGSGVDQHGHRLLLHGKSRAMGDGSVRIAAFKYKLFKWHGGVMDQGHMAFIQMIGGADWDDMAGDHLESAFDGSYSPNNARGGQLEAMLRNVGDPRTGLGTTQVVGHLTFHDVPVPGGLIDDPFFFDLGAELAGTVGPAKLLGDGTTIAPFGGIGLVNPPDPVLPHGIIAILIGQVIHDDTAIVPCVIPGDYRLYRSVADVFADVVHGRNTSFSQGEFFLPAVQ